MSDTHITMTLEFLPNEIFIECFEYLNALHIFYSFDQLNSRFNQLIRNIRLCVDFRNIHQQLICDQFCMKILSNPDIKKQIYSLHLSNNKDTSKKIHSFLSNFSLNELVHLRSLTLTEVTRYNLKKLKQMLPLMIELASFHLINYADNQNEILSALPMSQLQTLFLPKLPSNLKYILKSSSIVNLILSKCRFDELYEILSYGSNLKYVNIQHLSRSLYNLADKNLNSTGLQSIYLKQMILTGIVDKFDFVTILKRTPNLKSLTLDTDNGIDIVNAYEWEDLISSSLLHLNIFKFNFKYLFYRDDERNTYEEKFKQFQSDFWCEQHQWFTEYSLSKNCALIYTVPYTSDVYQLMPNTSRYSNKLMNNVKTMDNVRNLTIHSYSILVKCPFYFGHVTSMTLEYRSLFTNKSSEIPEHIQHLRMIVNLSSVKHLAISSHCEVMPSSMLLELLKQAPQISSLTIEPINLQSLLKDEEVCKYFSKMITKLDVWTPSNISPIDQFNLDKFCKIFSNIEQFTCKIDRKSTLIFLIMNLTKLSRIHATVSSSVSSDEICCVEKDLQKSRIKICYDFDDDQPSKLTIWIIRNITEELLV